MEAFETLTESEALAIAGAFERGNLSVRSDGGIDSDPLGDPQRIGERIAVGFAMLLRSEE